MRIEYTGPRVEVSNHGVVYKKSKEDKYVYLKVALEILKDIDNDYEKKPSYTHGFENEALREEDLHAVLRCYKSDIEASVVQECERYKQKIAHKIELVKNLPFLTDIDKEVWIKNIEITKDYKIQRAINKIYYMHCIHTIVEIIRHKRIKEITTPLNKNFFHVLNTIKGALITGIPSMDASVTEEIVSDNYIHIRLSIK